MNDKTSKPSFFFANKRRTFLTVYLAGALITYPFGCYEAHRDMELLRFMLGYVFTPREIMCTYPLYSAGWWPVYWSAKLYHFVKARK